MDSSVAIDLGLLTHKVKSSEVESTVASLVGKKPDQKYTKKPLNYESEVVSFASDFYSDKNIDDLISGKIPLGYDSEDPVVSRQLKSLSRAAPIALRICLLYTSPSPRDGLLSRMPSSA